MCVCVCVCVCVYKYFVCWYIFLTFVSFLMGRKSKKNVKNMISNE